MVVLACTPPCASSSFTVSTLPEYAAQYKGELQFPASFQVNFLLAGDVLGGINNSRVHCDEPI